MNVHLSSSYQLQQLMAFYQSCYISHTSIFLKHVFMQIEDIMLFYLYFSLHLNENGLLKIEPPLPLGYVTESIIII